MYGLVRGGISWLVFFKVSRQCFQRQEASIVGRTVAGGRVRDGRLEVATIAPVYDSAGLV